MNNFDPARTAFVVLGNQLFPPADLNPYRGCRFFLAEDLGLCARIRYHKQKLVLFLAAMRAYRDELREQGETVHYEQLDQQERLTGHRTYETMLGNYLDGADVTHLLMWEVEDKFFEVRIETFAKQRGLTLQFLPSPMFLTPRTLSARWLDEHRPFMAEFYKWQRRRLEILVDAHGSPRGGRWSFDDENRKPLPKSAPIAETPAACATQHVRELIPFVNRTFSDHPGELTVSGWWLPTTRQQALDWLWKFLEERLAAFGPFEDALSTRGPVLFHSALTPVLNLGLITPSEVLERTLRYAHEHDTPLNSLEGLVRQVIGWREFIRAIYRCYSEKQDHANFFQHRRTLTDHWYDGTTGLLPLDDVIAKAQRYGWTHHIERLMVAGNLMLLCEIEPREAHRWFMEMFVDSSEWVMGPNVYGMSLFSDGGIFATKPYICGSNYILKMSDYAKPRKGGLFDESDVDWGEVFDGLYWRFVDKNRDFLAKNARMGRSVGTFDRMNTTRRQRILTAADDFIAKVTG
ncbi:MAG: cryptochrome/photolyase family protein [Pseudomonadota bacterium]